MCSQDKPRLELCAAESDFPPLDSRQGAVVCEARSAHPLAEHAQLLLVQLDLELVVRLLCNLPVCVQRIHLNAKLDPLLRSNAVLSSVHASVSALRCASPTLGARGGRALADVIISS